MSPPSPTLDRLLATARRRLALRRAVHGAGVGLLVGTGLAAVATIARLVGLPAGPLLGITVAAPVVGLGVGATIGALRRGLDRRELALLADRCLGTDEALVTAVHQAAGGPVDARLATTLEGLGPRAAQLAADLPVRWPRASGPAALGWALCVAAVLWAPPVLAPFAPGAAAPDSPVQQEGEQLIARLEALEGRPEGSVLPEPLQRELSDLAADLEGDVLAPEEAQQRLAELEQQLGRFREELAPSERLLDDLERAAQALDADATQALGEALSQGDLDAAADAADDLSDALSQATPDEQREAAEALQQAGERLQQSSDPSLQQAGEALQQAGEQIAESQASGTPQGGAGQQPGGTPPDAPTAGSGGEPPLSPQQADDLRQALQQQRDLSERLERDRERLEQARDMQGAIGGAQERLGQGGGAPTPGEGEGEEQGAPQGAAGQGATVAGGGGAGAEHTWEDQGEFDPDTEFQDGRSAELQQAQGGGDDGEGHIDDFEKFYAPHRLDDVEALLATAEGDLDAQGRIDTLVTRLTESDETAGSPTLDLPAGYREAATEAIEAERIPPAYRDAVKHYFE